MSDLLDTTPPVPPLADGENPGRDEALALLTSRRVVILTGAGVSTDSGIPDYRGPGAPVRQPMTYQEFIGSDQARQRYWARSHIGWSRMSQARPNVGHLALARMASTVQLLVTQNVDGLHETAGSPTLALHGRISEVVCLGCATITSRVSLQTHLDRLNPGFVDAHADVASRPDGDVELEATEGFLVPECPCGGVLKPHVVFFGENVPAARVERTYAAVESLVGGGDRGAGGALVVVGSSLTVMSGLRFVKRAAKAGVPVVIVNRGDTRGDELATVRVEAGCSEFLTALADVRMRTATSDGSVV